MLQKLLFNKGLDSDTSPELFQVGFSRYRLNVRVVNSDNGESESVEPVLGNAEVAFALPAGTNKVIGAKEYLLKKKVYYFVYNSNNNHLILEYDQLTDTISVVFRDSVNILGNETNLLKFTETKLVTSIDIVKLDEENDLLYWVYENSEPYKLNIRKAKLFSAGDYVNGYESPFNPIILYRAKQPPLCPPETSWINVSSSSYTPEVLIEANISSTTPFASTTTSVIFPNVTSNTKGEYNASTGEINIIENGNRGLDLFVQTIDNAVYDLRSSATSPSYNATLYLIKNGAIASSVVGSASYVSNSYNFGLRKTYTNGVAVMRMTIPTLSLQSGDKLGFLIVISGYFPGTSSLNLTSSSLRLLKLASIVQDGAVNYLFKKLFTFKSQFVYDDYERSAFSPISKYSYPNTTAKGEDIVSQDNAMQVVVPTGSSIVKKIRIAAREVNSPDYYIVAELDKEALKIPDDSFYTYLFTNQNVIEPVEVNESIKLFDYVPIISRAQSIIPGNRIVDADITEGYDPVSINSEVKLIASSVLNYYPGTTNYKYPKSSFLKTGGEYVYGFIYYDKFNRSGLTNITPSTKIFIPFVNSSNYLPSYPSTYNKTTLIAEPQVYLYNSPPSWATHYQLAISKNKAYDRYFQFRAYKITYWDIALNTSSSVATATGVKIELGITSTIANSYNKENPNSLLVYSFVKGDRIRFINTKDDVPAAYNDQSVVSYDATTDSIIVELNASTPSLNGGYLFEIYNSTSVIDTSLMYEIGECHKIINNNGNLAHAGYRNQEVANTSSVSVVANTITVNSLQNIANIGDELKYISDTGYEVLLTLTQKNNVNSVYSYVGTITKVISVGISPSQTTSGILTKAAIIVIDGGDTYRTQKKAKYFNNDTSAVGNVTHWMESDSASLFFASKAWDFGRPNTIDSSYRQIRRQSTIYYSQPFIQETAINGLSSVFDTNLETYGDVFGRIMRLYADEQALFVMQQLKLSKVPVEQVVFNDTVGGNVVGASDKVLSAQPIYYQGDIGLSHAESFFVYGARKYGVDSLRGVVWRLSTDGLTLISDYFNHTRFTKLLRDVNNNPTHVEIKGVFDVRFNEAIFAVSPFSANMGETIAFTEKENLWTSYYSYKPEMMVSNNIDIITFKNGKLWKHNSGNVYNNFYGQQYESIVDAICNVSPSNIKVFLALSLEGRNTWSSVITTPITDECPVGQKTELIPDNFQMKEGFWYSPIFRDDFTPNIVADPNTPYLPTARFEGRQLRGAYCLVKLTYNGTAYTKLFAINVQVAGSNRSNI